MTGEAKTDARTAATAMKPLFLFGMFGISVPSLDLLFSLRRVGPALSIKIYRNCPGSPFAGVNSTCTGRKTMDFQHLNSALAYHYRAKRAYFGQYRDRFSTVACN